LKSTFHSNVDEKFLSCQFRACLVLQVGGKSEENLGNWDFVQASFSVFG